MNIISKLYLKFKQVVANIIYLSRYDLSKSLINKNNINYYLDNLKYELDSDLINVKKPLIVNPHNTIKKILEDKISISRFGDGEFELIFNRSIPFQESSPELSKRLWSILNSNVNHISIALPYMYWNSLIYNNIRIKGFVRGEISKIRTEYESLIPFERLFYSTEFTQLYMLSNGFENMELYFNSIINIWRGKDIVLIHGEGIFDGLEYNIFDNCNSIEYIQGPSKNAFSRYDFLYDKASKVSRNKLILIVLGPTATILAFDLSKIGFHVLDIGHTVKDYNYYRKGLVQNEDNISSFFSPD